jgi:hypothetical protein
VTEAADNSSFEPTNSDRGPRVAERSSAADDTTHRIAKGAPGPRSERRDEFRVGY